MEKKDVDVHSIVGTSIGALFACVFALGIPAGTIEQDIKTFFKTPENVFFPASTIVRVYQELGLDDAHITTRLLEKYFIELWGTTDVSFMDFAKKTGKDLVICASCIETSTATYFSVNTTPEVCVLTAIQASMTVPMVFRPVKIGEYHYVDGGITDNHPVDCFGERARDSMLAIKASVYGETCQNPMENMVSYLMHLVQISLRYWDRQYEKAKYAVVLDKPPVAFLPCSYTKEGIYVKITDKDVDASIEYGMTKAYELFTSPAPE